MQTLSVRTSDVECPCTRFYTRCSYCNFEVQVLTDCSVMSINFFVLFFQNNKSKSLSLDLSNLNTASFKSLLEEVVAYDTAKQTKSELYNVRTVKHYHLNSCSVYNNYFFSYTYIHSNLEIE